MAGERIIFDTAQYDRLIAQVQALAEDLRAATAGGAAGSLGPDLMLQPGVQEWNVSGDMVAEGSRFGTTVGGMGEALLTQLENLHDGLVDARSVFHSATDLASYSASQWAEEFPDLCPEPTS